MKLDHIPLDKLTPSKLNVRKHGGRKVDDLTLSIRTHGLLQPLLVRPDGEDFEIIAGQRRYHACRALAAEEGIDPLPCLIMETNDDVAAVEASLAENIARLPMDEIDQYRAFAALVAKGSSASEVADHFGVTERLVQQRLAIAGLYGPIVSAYRREEIDPATLRALTLATTRQQKAWWARFRDPEDYAPRGRALRAWLFGGQQIPVQNALFDLSDYDGAIIADLFGEERYFSDSEAFWRLQSKAVAAMKERYLAEGWSDVVLCEIGQFWPQWDHIALAKDDGGRVYITVTADGEVTAHEGFLTDKEARRRQQAEAQGNAALERPECTKAMQNYLALHRHAAVRTCLTAAPDVALRLMLAHVIAGSRLWQVDAEPQKAAQDGIAESIAASKAEAAFAEERRAVAALLGLGEDDEEPRRIVSQLPPYEAHATLPDVFARLMELGAPEIKRILASLMAETLQAGGETVETLGALLSVDMAHWWQPDETFFALLRDKEAINGMVAELAGMETAKAHCTATAKVQKGILKDCLDGTRQPKVANWLPGYLAFPMRGYTEREVLAA